MEVLLLSYNVIHRDGSGPVFLKRVPKPGGREGQLVDEWVEYQRPESERNADLDPRNTQDAPLRNEQVNNIHLVANVSNVITENNFNVDV